MIYRINRKQLFLICFFMPVITIIVTVIGVFLDFNIKNLIIFCLVSIFPTFVNIDNSLRELDSFIAVQSEFLHYKRLGFDIQVPWTEILRIEYKNPVRFRPFDTMILYTPHGRLFIDYTVENYMELWDTIVDFYKVKCDSFNIDKKLEKILTKHALYPHK